MSRNQPTWDWDRFLVRQVVWRGACHAVTPNLDCRILWSTVSNAADRYRPIRTVICLLLAAVDAPSTGIKNFQCSVQFLWSVPSCNQTGTRWIKFADPSMQTGTQACQRESLHYLGGRREVGDGPVVTRWWSAVESCFLQQWQHLCWCL